MRLATSELRACGVALLISVLSPLTGCSAHPSQTTKAVPLSGNETSPVGATKHATNEGEAPTGPRRGRIPLGGAREESLDYSILPIPGGRSLLFVSQFGDQRLAFARRLDGETGLLDPTLRFVDEHIYGAFDASDGRYVVVSSQRAEAKRECEPRESGKAWGCLCISTYVPGRDKPESRGCADVSPSAITLLGDRIALLDTVVTEKPKAAKSSPKSASPKKEQKKQETRSKKNRTKKSSSKKKKKSTKKSKKKATSHGARRAAPRPPVLLKWQSATLEGRFDAESKSTGLKFTPPLDGMTLIDVRPKPPGADLLWYESAPKHKGKSRLGGAVIAAGTLGEDGSFDPKSRVTVLEGDLEYGYLHGHKSPRLFEDGQSSVYVGLDEKGKCEAIQLFPAPSRLSTKTPACVVDPGGVISGATPDTTLAKILESAPQRVRRQPKEDLERAIWAKDRAYFLSGRALRSASRNGQDVRTEASPFKAFRSRLAFGAFERDGEGVAFVDGRVVRVGPDGKVESIALPEPKPAFAAALSEPASSADKRMLARIGSTWWLGRGDIVELWPKVMAPAALSGMAAPDTTALVGGAQRGLLLEVVGNTLRIAALDASGKLSRLGGGKLASPVRAGFGATERGAGGALVAGVSTRDAAKVIAFTVDEEGHLGKSHELPLALQEGEFGLRVTALPGGGAWVSDMARRRVVWIDDEGKPQGATDVPEGEDDALCPDGRALPRKGPGLEAGKLVELSNISPSESCINGDMVWSRAGTLAWFGSSTKGTSSLAEAVIVESGTALSGHLEPRPLEAMSDMKEGKEPACPADMVSVAGRYCIDRFEASLVDRSTGESLSTDYPVTPGLLDFAFGAWVTERERTGGVHARAFPLPWISSARFGHKTEPVARNRHGVRPNGYLTGLIAESACAAAGKRLCSLEEFVNACRGEDDTAFPYGDSYEDGVCNVFREDHPAAMLHDNASIGHLDPRLNRVGARGRPLFEETGKRPRCRSRWGNDAVYDLVGNLDEWIDEEGGAFAGGFYSRSTRAGCDAIVTAHPKGYLDYSTGVRCCKDAAGAAAHDE